MLSEVEVAEGHYGISVDDYGAVCCNNSREHWQRRIRCGNIRKEAMSTMTLTQKSATDTIDFASMSARSVAARANGAIRRTKGLVDEITSVPPKARSQETVLVPLNAAEVTLGNALMLCQLLAQVHPDASVREAADAGEERLKAFETGLELNPALYKAIKDVDADTLESDYQRMREHKLRDFKRKGVDRDAKTRQRVQKLEDAITKVGQTFDNNCRDARGSIRITPDKLAGLPQSYVSAHKPNDEGLVTITTDYPDYVPFMTYAEDEDARRELYFVRNNLAPENEAALQQLRELRQELAELLGYADYADYVTEDKMMKSAANAAAFIDRLDAFTAERAQADYEQLLAFKRAQVSEADTVNPWEGGYLSEKLRREQYAFDSTSVMPYFRYGNVRQGIFALVERAFSVRIVQDTDAPVWHESVEAFLIYDRSGDEELLGRFYLDMHPRAGKYSHAACFPIADGSLGIQLPQASLVCNFTPETEDAPALMQHGEAVTFLHEFGHLIHTLLGGRHRVATQSGFNVEWDFVEAPSQMLENFFKSTKALQTFALHHETGKPIPAGLVRKMLSAGAFGRGLFVRRQAWLAWLSLNAYTQVTVPMADLDRECHARFEFTPYLEGQHWYTVFGHLSGYSAIYYTYQNSKVISLDMWTPFDANDPFAGDAAMRYRKEILEPGGSKDAADLVAAFLGRPVSFDAYEHWLAETPEDLA